MKTAISSFCILIATGCSRKAFFSIFPRTFLCGKKVVGFSTPRNSHNGPKPFSNLKINSLSFGVLLSTHFLGLENYIVNVKMYISADFIFCKPWFGNTLKFISLIYFWQHYINLSFYFNVCTRLMKA